MAADLYMIGSIHVGRKEFREIHFSFIEACLSEVEGTYLSNPFYKNHLVRFQ